MASRGTKPRLSFIRGKHVDSRQAGARRFRRRAHLVQTVSVENAASRPVSEAKRGRLPEPSFFQQQLQGAKSAVFKIDGEDPRGPKPRMKLIIINENLVGLPSGLRLHAPLQLPELLLHV